MNIHKAEWKIRDYDGFEHCSYCGSVKALLFVSFLRTPGSQFSGSDWKYGWPHKFYLTTPDQQHLKFYNEHLKDLDTQGLTAFSELSNKFFKITWSRDERGLRYSAAPSNCRFGLQMWGVVGPDGEPDFSPMASAWQLPGEGK